MPTERASAVEIDLPVYTGIFKLQRRLYRVYDVELPMPISFPQATAFLAVAALVFVVLRAVGIALSPGTAWAFLVPPGVAAWLANRPVSDQRTPLQWIGAQLRFVLEPRSIIGLGGDRARRQARLSVAVWEQSAPKAKVATAPERPKPPKIKVAKAPKTSKPVKVKVAKLPQPPKPPKPPKVKVAKMKVAKVKVTVDDARAPSRPEDDPTPGREADLALSRRRGAAPAHARRSRPRRGAGNGEVQP